jgi:hypothetical protein
MEWEVMECDCTTDKAVNTFQIRIASRLVLFHVINPNVAGKKFANKNSSG